MLKTLQSILHRDRERFKVPKRVQDTIPVQRIWNDGIFKIGSMYAKTFKFSDINYSLLSYADKKALFEKYCDLINAFESGTRCKLTICVSHYNEKKLRDTLCMPLKHDGLDRFREEMNERFRRDALGTGNFLQERYLTVSVPKNNVRDARVFFQRISGELSTYLARLGSKCEELDATEKLALIHRFFRPEEENAFYFNAPDMAKKGHSFKDYICPDSMEIKHSYIKIGDRYVRTVFLRDYANYIKDALISEICSIGVPLILSMDLIPIPMDEAVREVEGRLLGVETNIANWQRRQNQNNNFSATIPFDMEGQRKDSKAFLDDLMNNDQRMLMGVLSITLTADSPEELKRATDALFATANGKLCQFATLRFQQLDGLNSTLPYGTNRIQAIRTLNTRSAAVFIPFRAEEVFHAHGVYCGKNSISGNLIVVNKAELMNGSAMHFGIPGSGKSFFCKDEILQLILNTNDDILICDPEREYRFLDQFGGAIIRIAAGSNDHINAMDMVEGYGDARESIAQKADFVMSLFEQIDKDQTLSSAHKSIVDRCTGDLYRNYQRGGPLPTLTSLRELLLAEPEKEAQELSISLERFTKGSLNVFSYPTNVDTKNRIVVYDILDLGEQLKTMGLLVILDAILNRVTENWKQGRRTHVFIDEFHVVYENEYSSAFFNSAWRRFRKRGAYPTGITQNVEYLLKNESARSLLSNSEFVVMHNQAPSDSEKLAALFNISNDQRDSITNAEPGSGLLKIGNALVPFVNRFPKDTELYKCMTTKPGEAQLWMRQDEDRTV